MTGLPVMSGKELIKILVKDGFAVKKAEGKPCASV
ncbi:hypothetical protein Metlim_3001 [Methanoplanus limicola DSM 2279]|uniref:Uncharacterized protein n=1 Tax=Methanoplanus limicola DSM 2279 TaxID=937775 RepID=H1YYW1_9EURY|nr:hypothetical protein Metlim_3001 [Methanoplanus limicola DSM 2279]